MTADNPRVPRVLLALLCAGLIGLLAAFLWVFYAHPFTILFFGLPRWTAQRRKTLRRLLRDFEILVARAFDKYPAASPPKSKIGRRAQQ